MYWSLSGVLEVKDGLDRTGMKKRDTHGQKLHAMEYADALPGSAKLVHAFKTTGLTTAHFQCYTQFHGSG